MTGQLLSRRQRRPVGVAPSPRKMHEGGQRRPPGAAPLACQGCQRHRRGVKVGQRPTQPS